MSNQQFAKEVSDIMQQDRSATLKSLLAICKTLNLTSDGSFVVGNFGDISEVNEKLQTINGIKENLTEFFLELPQKDRDSFSNYFGLGQIEDNLISSILPETKDNILQDREKSQGLKSFLKLLYEINKSIDEVQKNAGTTFTTQQPPTNLMSQEERDIQMALALSLEFSMPNDKPIAKPEQVAAIIPQTLTVPAVKDNPLEDKAGIAKVNQKLGAICKKNGENLDFIEVEDALSNGGETLWKKINEKLLHNEKCHHLIIPVLNDGAYYGAARNDGVAYYSAIHIEKKANSARSAKSPEEEIFSISYLDAAEKAPLESNKLVNSVIQNLFKSSVENFNELQSSNKQAAFTNSIATLEMFANKISEKAARVSGKVQNPSADQVAMEADKTQKMGKF